MKEVADQLNRRTVLKAGTGIVGGTGIITAMTGAGAAARSADVAFLRTEQYKNQYDNATSKLYDVRDYCFNTWQEFLEGAIYTSTSGPFIDKEIQTTILSGRANNIDEWLRERSVYDDYDAFLVLDYVDGSNSPGNAVGIGTAGSNDDKTAVVNASADDNGYEGVEYMNSVGLEGAAFHELGHLFNATHPQAEVMGDRASLMFAAHDDREPQCGGNNDSDAVEEMGHWISPCNIGQINEYTEDNFS